ncbi:MAG: hypothetical protein IPI33_00410 [Dehalococcoidia bacterium]|nr:hypothetical protein [Dehalococcoidia bacterium]
MESPTKARTVKNILGDDYEVIASVGHVRDLPPYGYGVESVEKLDFTPKYVVVKDKRRGVDKSDVVADIAKAAKHATRVFPLDGPRPRGRGHRLAHQRSGRDPGRQGDARGLPRITKPAIEAAFAEATGGHVDGAADHGRRTPGKIDMDLVDAQQARRVLDRLIGFPLTWFVQKKVSRGASAGRVQSVALGLIVKREKEIQSFRAVEHWSIHAGLEKAGRGFEAELANFPAMTKGASMRPPFRAAGPAIPDESAANSLATTFNRSEFSVASVTKGEKRRGPVPPLHDQHLPAGCGEPPRHERRAGDGHRPGALRGSQRSIRTHHLHAHRLGEHFPNRATAGTRLDLRRLGEPVHPGQRTRLRDPEQRRPGSARGHPADRPFGDAGEPSARLECRPVAGIRSSGSGSPRAR